MARSTQSRLVTALCDNRNPDEGTSGIYFTLIVVDVSRFAFRNGAKFHCSLFIGSALATLDGGDRD
jgi:hypothetical protein